MPTDETTTAVEKGWQYYYDLGKKAFDDKKYDSAIIYLENVIKDKEGFADVYNMLGLLYFNKSRHEDAIRSFKKALEINPKYMDASLNLTVVYNELGQLDQSSGVYEKAKNLSGSGNASYLDPFVKGKLANMHADLGTIYKDLGMYADAADEYRKGLRLKPEFMDIRINLGTVYRSMKEYGKSISELNEAVRLNPRYAEPVTQLGLTYYMMGDVDMAREQWGRALALRPDDKKAQMYLNLITGVKK